MLATLFASETLTGVVIGASVSLLVAILNFIIESLKEARRERKNRLSEVRKELGLDQGVQGGEVILYINSELPWWSRVLMLFGINLHHPDLSNANLRRANLAGKNLAGVNFSYANLTEADLSNTNLKGANFQGAILIKTIFKSAKFDTKTKFSEAILFETPGVEESALNAGITNISRLEHRFGKPISSPDDLEKLLVSNRIDTTSIAVKEIYQSFSNNDKRHG